MNDICGTPITNIRVSLTKRCNLACFYCHREGESKKEERTKEIGLEELDNLLSVARDLGIDRVRFTGGEPLLREDILEVVKIGSKYMDDVSITTNGVFLGPLAKGLKRSGLSRINVTLNSIVPEVYASMTGADVFHNVVEGIEQAHKAGIRPLKINMVVVKRNVSEIPEMISFIKEGMTLQLIELIASRLDENDVFYRENHVDFAPLEELLEQMSLEVEVRQKHKRKRYILPQIVEVVRSMHNSEFCRNCNSIRITSEGMVKKCLFNNNLRMIDDFNDQGKIREALKKTISEKRPYW